MQQAPHPGLRSRIFEALRLWIDLVEDTFGPGRVWINGGFVTHKPDPPKDVDVAFLPSAPLDVDAAIKTGTAFQLLTVQDLLFSHPAPGGHLQRLQPVGGLVDAFLADTRNPTDAQIWFDIWSSVKGPDGEIIGGVRKGFLEVIIGGS
ncbi:hypothetical protein KMZ32_05960 [Phycicoccus sp. MAQZ13P-2]|nr:hypothetical protein [Phycicoccus mangrovi]MBT9273618.1 hypothetical protein [Phycicoccus mangrovi]